ncbi:MAG: extracellular solute-binding protein [Actinomycetota bacterium]|nr:extracellular solute-binding protein [Actinomycetota bacterium]
MKSTQGDSGTHRRPPVRGHTSGRRRRADGSRRRGRLRWTPALVVAAGMALAACGASAPSASKVTPKRTAAPQVTTVSLWESHNGGPVGDAVSALVARFNASHPSVQVDVTVTKASKKLLAATAAGDPPVLAEISHYDGQYVKAHALVSWNTFMAGSSVVDKANVLPAVWKNGEVNGQHFRLEADTKVSIVDYNKALFAKAGITTPPATWTELAADAAKLKATGVIPIGWKDSSAHILPAFMSNGGTMLRGGNTTGTAVDFNTPAGTTTFSYFHTLYAGGDLVFGHGTSLREDLAAGKMAMIDGTSAGYQKTLDAVSGKFPVGAFVEPAGSTGHAYNVAQGLGFVLPKGHTHAQDEAAWTFVQWWFEPSQQVYWAEHTGFPPETKAGVAAMPSSFLTSHPGEAATITATESPDTYPRPLSDRYKEVQSSLDATFLEVVEGKESVVAGLHALDQQGNSYMSGASAL